MITVGDVWLLQVMARACDDASSGCSVPLLHSTAGTYDGWRITSWNFRRLLLRCGCLIPEHFGPKGRHCLYNQKKRLM
jgi:hypothetical protein